MKYHSNKLQFPPVRLLGYCYVDKQPSVDLENLYTCSHLARVILDHSYRYGVTITPEYEALGFEEVVQDIHQHTSIHNLSKPLRKESQSTFKHALQIIYNFILSSLPNLHHLSTSSPASQLTTPIALTKFPLKFKWTPSHLSVCTLIFHVPKCSIPRSTNLPSRS